MSDFNVALIVCTVAAILATANGGAAQAQGRIVCPMVYKPVCGRLPDRSLRTFGNACQAHGAGATVVADGRCHDERIRPHTQ